MYKSNENNEYITIPQAAKLLGESRISVYKKVKSGKIESIRIGRNYAISREYIDDMSGKGLSSLKRKKIDKAVQKTVKEYGETLKLLGRN